jgi:hypothetical protein
VSAGNLGVGHSPLRGSTGQGLKVFIHRMRRGDVIMMLDLSSQELELLQRIVRQYYMSLREEIYHTESSAFKKNLKDEEAQLDRLLEKLESKLNEPMAA